MAITKEIRAITGTYTDREGNEKKSYATIGRIMTTNKGGEMIKLDTVPVNWDGWAYLQDPKPREAKEGGKANGYQPGNDAPEDDIPF
jgi:hypothetical protein